jgi:hypothetical protein
MIVVLQSVDGSGKPAPQLIYVLNELAVVHCQMQSPGFMRIASRPEILIQNEVGVDGGILIEKSMGIVRLEWRGPLYAIAGGTTRNPNLRIAANFEQFSIQQIGTVTPNPFHDPLAMPSGYVELPLTDDEEGTEVGVHGTIDSGESFSDSILSYDVGGLLKRIFHP